MRLASALALTMAVLLAAHVGSPDVFWSGKAGPYAIDVVVRPPQVVPGIAEILVRAPDAGVERVTVRPVYWRAGSRGRAQRRRGEARGERAGHVHRQTLAHGGWFVQRARRRRGQGGAGASPSFPSPQSRPVSCSSRDVCACCSSILGTLLVAGVVTAVYAAVGESQVPPGEVGAARAPPPRARRRLDRRGDRRTPRARRREVVERRSEGVSRARCTRRSAHRSP